MVTMFLGFALVLVLVLNVIQTQKRLTKTPKQTKADFCEMSHFETLIGMFLDHNRHLDRIEAGIKELEASTALLKAMIREEKEARLREEQESYDDVDDHSNEEEENDDNCYGDGDEGYSGDEDEAYSGYEDEHVAVYVNPNVWSSNAEHLAMEAYSGDEDEDVDVYVNANVWSPNAERLALIQACQGLQGL